MAVERCRWSLLPQDSFVEIAPRFQTNWLQLWYLNPAVGHPDFALRSAMQAVNIGRVYAARWDDTVCSCVCLCVSRCVRLWLVMCGCLLDLRRQVARWLRREQQPWPQWVMARAWGVGMGKDALYASWHRRRPALSAAIAWWHGRWRA